MNKQFLVFEMHKKAHRWAGGHRLNFHWCHRCLWPGAKEANFSVLSGREGCRTLVLANHSSSCMKRSDNIFFPVCYAAMWDCMTGFTCCAGSVHPPWLVAIIWYRELSGRWELTCDLTVQEKTKASRFTCVKWLKLNTGSVEMLLFLYGWK